MGLQRGCFAQAASGQTALRAADIASLDYPTVQTLFFIDRALRKVSDGDLSIRVFPDAQLGQETEVIEQLRIGAIDMARVNVMSLADVVPEFAVLGLPGTFLSDAHFDTFTGGTAGQVFLEHLEGTGFVGLTFLEGGTRHLYNRVRPIERVEDMQGLRLRTDLSSASGFLYRALGTTGVQLPLSHVLPALEARLIDGAIENIATYVALGHYRAAPFIAMTEMGRPPDILLISQRAWNGLTAGQRKLLKNTSGDARSFMKKSFEYWTRACMQQIRDRGVTQTHPDALLQPARGAIDAMLAQLDMMKWFEVVRSAQ
ncbi:TRAP transporter substrate-binding protein DctP [Roseiarcaceae bacterium H3SJ34-1]|nr:TRAP transporter substrate-binding protein DctP [Roseiarcaceae bacterium H3SJ34-1]